MKIVALNTVPGHKDIAGVATPHPVDDPGAHRLTLRTSRDEADLDATWMLTAFLTSVAPVIAKDGWSAALRRFDPKEWSSATAKLVLLEDPTNVLGPGLPDDADALECESERQPSTSIFAPESHPRQCDNAFQRFG